MSETDQLLAKQKAVEARALAQFERDKMPEKKDDAAQPVQAAQEAASVALPVATPTAVQIPVPQVAVEAPVIAATPVAAPVIA